MFPHGMPKADHRYLALGDSYTIGEGVAPEQRWPAQWVTALRAHGVRISDPKFIARTGWTTDELSAALDQAEQTAHLRDKPFDLVSLLIGVNNQYRGRSVSSYAEEFAALLKRAIAYADGNQTRVVVLSIPDWGATLFARSEPMGRSAQKIAGEIDAYNDAAQKICAAAKVRFVDITNSTRSGAIGGQRLVADGLHPNGEEYALWVQQLMREFVVH
jgi:lysophospholipase L1-like esterase